MPAPRPLALASIVAIAALASFGLGSSPATATPPTLTLTPNTNLVGGQDVVLTGTGWNPNGATWCQGQRTTAGLDCAVGPGSPTGVAPDGTFSVTVRVHRDVLVTGNDSTHWVDCTATGANCVIVVMDASDSQLVTVPLQFGAPPPPPATRGTTTVSPAANLHHLDPVTVSGTGFRANARVEVVLCDGNATRRADCDFRATEATTDASGTFAPVSMEVPSSYIDLPTDTRVECWTAPGACTLAVAELSDFTGTVVRTPLTFVLNTTTPGGHLRPHDALLGGRDSVNVVAWGFTPGVGGVVCQGVNVGGAFSTDWCGQRNAEHLWWPAYEPVFGDGSFEAPMNLEADVFVPALGRWVDCTGPGAACSVLAFTTRDGLTGQGPAAVIPLQLAPRPAPPAQRGTVTVRTTDLRFGDRVTLNATGFRANQRLDVSICKTGSLDRTHCDQHWQNTFTNGSGATTADYRIWFDSGVIKPLGAPSFDCRAAPSACSLVVGETVDFEHTLVGVPIDFGYDPLTDVVVRRISDGALLFDNIYTIAPTAYTHAIAPGGQWSFSVLIQNDSVTTNDVVVKANTVTAPYRVRYFAGFFDITLPMTGAGFVWKSVPPGATRNMVVQFSADPTTTLGTHTDAVVQAHVTNYPSPSTDAVKLRVRAVAP